jgi:hypothetical protein
MELQLPAGIDPVKLFDDINPSQAKEIQPDLTATYQSHIAATVAAEAKLQQRRDLRDAARAVAQYWRELQRAKTSALTSLETELRAEFSALQSDFDLDDQVSRLRRLRDSVNYIDGELDRHLRLTLPGVDLDVLDAEEIACNCRARELHVAATLSHITTVAQLGPVYAAEQGLGVVGTRTTNLLQQAAVASKQHEMARNAARESRQAFEKANSAWVNRGLIVGQGR